MEMEQQQQQQVGSGRNPSYIKLEEERKSKKRKTCLRVGIASTVLFIVLCVVLYLAVLKPKQTTTTIDSIKIQDLKFRFDNRFVAQLNLSLAVDVSIRNPNKAGFRYKDTTMLFSYRGDRVVGVIPLPGENVRADSAVGMNLTVTVLADRLLGDPRLVPDIVGGGVLPFTTDVELAGKVTILGFIRFKLKASSSCKVDVDLYKEATGDQECTSKVKFS